MDDNNTNNNNNFSLSHIRLNWLAHNYPRYVFNDYFSRMNFRYFNFIERVREFQIFYDKCKLPINAFVNINLFKPLLELPKRMTRIILDI